MDLEQVISESEVLSPVVVTGDFSAYHGELYEPRWINLHGLHAAT